MKKSDARQFIKLLERRAASLRLMARELRECRESFTSMDFAAMRDHILYQKNLCCEILGLDEELGYLQGKWAAASGLPPKQVSPEALEEMCDAHSSSQLRQAMNDLAVFQTQVRRLNRVYSGLLQRSRRFTDVLLHVIANYASSHNPAPGRGVVDRLPGR